MEYTFRLQFNNILTISPTLAAINTFSNKDLSIVNMFLSLSNITLIEFNIGTYKSSQGKHMLIIIT